MNRPLIINILSSFGDKAFTAIAMLMSTVILVRLIPREDFGIIGVVAGCAVLIQIVNLSLESVLLREYNNKQRHIEECLANFMYFNFIKSLGMLLIGVLMAVILSYAYQQPDFKYAVASLTIIVCGDALVAPMMIYASLQYKQHVISFLNAARLSIGLLLLLGLSVWPMLEYLLIKDAVVTLIYITLWIHASNRYLGVNLFKLVGGYRINVRAMLSTIKGYSIWVHLTSISTLFIYRADAVFLSFFAPLTTVGNYNIALNCANVANIAPMILGFQNSVALSHAKDETESHRLTGGFIRLSVYIGIATLAAFLFLGMVYLESVTGTNDVDDIYFYMICIAISLVMIKTIASPMSALINIKGDVRRHFVMVIFPTFIFSFISYFVAAFLYGADGVAISNIINALLWMILLGIEVRRLNYRLPSIKAYIGDALWLRTRLRKA